MIFLGFKFNLFLASVSPTYVRQSWIGLSSELVESLVLSNNREWETSFLRGKEIKAQMPELL